MSILRRARDAARQAKLAAEIRRLKSRIAKQELALGRLLYPLIAHGALEVESPEVHSITEEIKALSAALREKE